MDSADTGTDVEHTCANDAVAENDLDELLGGWVESPFTPPSDIGRRVQTVISEERKVLVATEPTPRSRHDPMVRVRVNRSPTAQRRSFSPSGRDGWPPAPYRPSRRLSALSTIPTHCSFARNRS
jgi:hypothetical protein